MEMEKDTIQLLQECNAGIKMGMASIDEVLPKVKSAELRRELEQCKGSHSALGQETRTMLNRAGDSGKEPSPMAKTMAWMKTNVKLSLEPEDSTIADVLTDGCNMGIKSLTKYLNEYSGADRDSKDIARRLITLEKDLVEDMRPFL